MKPGPSWFVDPDDPEAGYIDGDEVETCEVCSGRGEVEVVALGALPWDAGRVEECPGCDGRGRWHHETGERVDPAPCSICERVLSMPTPRPLCPRCDRTARAHGRADAERRRQEQDNAA